MIQVNVLNLSTGQTFIKEFDSPYLARNFMLKCRYSKKVKCISYSTNSREANEYLNYYF